jgi:predicted nicotinamide N-methyase
MKSRVIDSFSLFGEREDITYHIFSENQQDDNVGIESSMNIEEFVRIRALKVVSGDDNKLFVNHVWEGSIVLTDFIVKNFAMFINNSVLELGAGTSLPSIVASKFSPSVVVASDFPDENLLNHIKLLSTENKCESFFVEPHKWGDSV